MYSDFNIHWIEMPAGAPEVPAHTWILIDAAVEVPQVRVGALNGFFVAALGTELPLLIVSRLQLKKIAMANTAVIVIYVRYFMILYLVRVV